MANKYSSSLETTGRASRRRRLATLGAIGLGTDPAHFAAFLKAERAAMEALVRDAKITVD